MNSPAERPLNSRRWVWPVAALAALFAALVYFYAFYPDRDIGPQQPIYFSHRVHAGVKEISCRFCHPYAGRSHNAGIPTVAKCLYCHGQIIPQHPQIVKERRYLETKTPVPWVRIYYLPDHVKFNHRPHIEMGFDCAVCHGEVRKMDRLKPVEFKMQFCISCHKPYGAQMDCWLACHN